MGLSLPFEQLASAGVSAASNIYATEATNKANREMNQATNETNIQIAKENNELQKSMNDQNNQFSHDEAALGHQRNIELMNLQHQLNSPLELVKQYREAGLNPAVMMSGQSGSATSAATGSPVASPHGSGISPSMPVLTPGHDMPYPDIASGISESIYKLAQAKKLGADTRTIEETRNLLKRDMEAGARSKEIANNIQEAFGSQIASATHAKLIQEARTGAALADSYIAKGDFDAAQAVLSREKAATEQIIRSAKGEERDLLRKQNETYWNRYEVDMRRQKSEIGKNNAQAGEAIASAEEHRAGANLKDAQAMTEDVLRDARLELLKQDTEYKIEEVRNQPFIREKLANEALEIAERQRGQQFDNDLRAAMILDIATKIHYDAMNAKGDYYFPWRQFKFFGK